MVNISCKNCGGTMVLDASGMTAVCHYCDSRYVLDHQDTDYYQDFFARMNSFFAAPKNDQERKQKAEALWEKANEKTFVCDDGTPIEIKYMYKYSEKDAEIYVARRNIIFHFKENGAEKTELLRKNASLLDYPSADIRNLSDFFPSISGGFVLDDGSHICVVAKDEDEYPLRLFGNLPGRHVAWIVSRLENLCCVLEFSSLVHPQISPDTVYINPYTHQASLYGNWWNVGKVNTFFAQNRSFLQSRQNLIGIRNTAAYLLGYENRALIKATPDVPKYFAEFIKSDPCITAYDDFAYWDDMMIKSYGERKFVTLSTDDESIYKTKG